MIPDGRFPEEPALVERAFHYALNWHGGQVRKGSRIPYVSHLLAVASLVVEDNGTEEQLIAALLHDSAEDQGGEEILSIIRSEFGPDVEELVRSCSDYLGRTGDDKPDWWERKQQVVDRIADVDSRALIVIAADKLHNMRSTVHDLRVEGAGVWNRFRAGREGFIWYHREVHLVLGARIPGSRSVQAAAHELELIESLSR